MRRAHPRCVPSQTWSVFFNHHAKDVWACDFLAVIDLFFRQAYLFFIVELTPRRIVHYNVTAHPTDARVAQQLREATPFGQAPRFLIRDRDCKYGDAFTRAAKASTIELLKTPYREPKANAICVLAILFSSVYRHGVLIAWVYSNTSSLLLAQIMHAKRYGVQQVIILVPFLVVALALMQEGRRRQK